MGLALSIALNFTFEIKMLAITNSIRLFSDDFAIKGKTVEGPLLATLSLYVVERLERK
jgi:hypothetical protein